MVRRFNKLFFLWFCGVRLFVAVKCWDVGTIGLSLVAAVCVAEVAGAVANRFYRVDLDTRWRSLLVPLCYAVGALRVVVVPSPVLDAGIGLVAALQLYVMAYLRASVTVAGPSFVKLRSGGPYRLIRHPQDALGVVARVVYLVALPCATNAIAAGALLVGVVLHVLVEESYLRSRPEWVSYARRVRWRLVPGVW